MAEQKSISLPAIISVKDLADKIEMPVTKLISMLMKNGIMATINESLDFETAAIIAEENGLTAVLDEKKLSKPEVSKSEKLEYRSPIVTIMGHVDHGKTTLLDAIRQTNVASGESGGITQHIGAYQVEIKKSSHHTSSITFLDTPGHAAFTAMRQHGANITDIVVLVVAANDGVKAQTIEAIDHAKQANVPIIVAINKIDLPDTNMDRVKQQLAELDMVSEEWGGKTVMVPVSAKTRKGIDDLLDMILLVSDMQELKAHSKGNASGVIVESHMEPGKGPQATVLIQNGQLKVGDPISVGQTYGKIRTLQTFLGKKVESAGPSEPITISGIHSLPNFGEQLIVTESDKEAKESAIIYSQEHILGKVHSMHKSSLEDAVENYNGEQHELNVIINADVQGSLEAINKVLSDLGTSEVSVKITHQGVGAVTESDVTMAAATKSSILAFRVPVNTAIRNLAHSNKVIISNYDVIYELVDDAKRALSKLLPPEENEVITGVAKVIAIFSGDKRSRVIGVQIEDGSVSKGATFHLKRKKDIIASGNILNVRREKEVVREAIAGQQAGILVPGDMDVHEKDLLETYKIEVKTRTL